MKWKSYTAHMVFFLFFRKYFINNIKIIYYFLNANISTCEYFYLFFFLNVYLRWYVHWKITIENINTKWIRIIYISHPPPSRDFKKIDNYYCNMKLSWHLFIRMKLFCGCYCHRPRGDIIIPLYKMQNVAVYLFNCWCCIILYSEGMCERKYNSLLDSFIYSCG
jgi:hypothetical protein